MHINDLELYFMILQQIKNDLDNLLLCLHGKNMFVTPLCFPHPCIVRKFTSSYIRIGLTIWFVSSCPFILSSLFPMYISTWLAFSVENQKLNSRLRGPREKLRVYLCVYTTKEKTNFSTFLLNKLKM